MTIAAAPGYPVGGSAGTSKYVQQLYAKQLLIALYLQAVYPDICQRDYEGQISKMGDKVIIRTRPTVVVSDYSKGMDLNTIRQYLEPPNIELNIDKAKVYSVGLDDIDEKQFDIDALAEWASDAAASMAIELDADVLNNIYTDVHAKNTGATAGAKSSGYNIGTPGAPVTLTKANILDYIVYCASVLNEQNVPKDGSRWMVLPEIFLSRINTSDLRSALFTGDSGNPNLRNGRVGQIAGFTIYGSNNIDAVTGSVYPIMFGHKMAVTFASQLVKNRTIELQNTFGKAMEGLHVYGYEVVKREAVGCMYAQAG